MQNLEKKDRETAVGLIWIRKLQRETIFMGVRKLVMHLFSFPVFGHPCQPAANVAIGHINYAAESAMYKNACIKIFIYFQELNFLADYYKVIKQYCDTK